jgi:hypothetical protein
MVCYPVLATFLPRKCPQNFEISGKFHYRERTDASEFSDILSKFHYRKRTTSGNCPRSLEIPLLGRDYTRKIPRQGRESFFGPGKV